MSIFDGARDRDLDWPARVNLFGPLGLIALGLGMFAGTAIVVLL